MTFNTVRTMVFAAAAMTLGAASSYGQTRLVADINFNFKSTTADMPAGKYEVHMTRSGGGPVFQLRNLATSKSVLIASGYYLGSLDKYTPKLVFRCNASGCGLTEIWMGGGETGYKTARPHLSPAQQERIAVVPMTRFSHSD